MKYYAIEVENPLGRKFIVESVRESQRIYKGGDK